MARHGSHSAAAAAAPRAGSRKRGQQYHNPHRVAKAKKVTAASCSEQQGKRGNNGEDRISQLPEDILITILSLLTLQEAGRTSVLSHRWRSLWTFRRRLNFDASKSLYLAGCDGRGALEFARRVNDILKLHRGLSIDEFKINYPMGITYSRDIDSWVNFAFEKGVKRFELDLAAYVLGLNLAYDFPSMERFFLNSSVEQRVHSNGNWPRTVVPDGFCSLTTLRLRAVNITGKVIEQFLGNCPFLESLQVVYSNCIGKLKVAGPSLKLKCLEISRCHPTFLEISATNLISLTYDGPPCRLLLKNVPILSELCAGTSYCTSLIFESCQHFNSLHRLQSLKLNLPCEVVENFVTVPLRFPKLSCLKQLELEFRETRGKRLILYTSFIKACPFLSKFTMRYTLRRPTDVLKGRAFKWFTVTDRVPAAKFEHQYLKVVELVGFSGHSGDLGLVSLLLETAVSLDKMIIHPRKPCVVDYPKAFYDTTSDAEALSAARKCAWQLEEKLPSGVELVVL